MRMERKVLFFAVVLAAAVWVLDALFDYLFFLDAPFLDLLVTDVPVYEVYVRAMGMGACLVFGAVMSVTLGQVRRARERRDHLNRMLRAIRNVNQLIAREGDKASLLQGACNLLVEDRGFTLAWIVLTDGSGLVSVGGSPGQEEARTMLRRMMEENSYPPCVSEALNSPLPLQAYREPVQHQGCPLVDRYGVNAALVSRLEHEGKVYGAMGVSVPQRFANDREEEDLFLEVAGDVAYALHGFEEEETRAAAERSLARALEESRLRQAEVTALLEAAQAVMDKSDFLTAARAIFGACKGVVGATAGYVALLSESGQENEVLFLDSGGRECTVDPSLPMPIRGLRAEAFHDAKGVYHNDFGNSQWMQYMPSGHVTLENVLFVPLVIGGKAVGLMGLANKPGGFDDDDARMARAFGELAAIALRNARNLELLWASRQDLQRSEQFYRSLLGATGGWVVRVNKEGKRTYVSEETLEAYGAMRDDIMSGEFGDHMVPEDREKAWELLRQTFETGDQVRGFVSRQVFGGQVRYVLAHWEPIKDARGNVAEVQTTSFDITERMEAEQSRERAERFQAIASMTGGMAHDINNVLAAITLWADVARRHVTGPQGEAAVQNILEGARSGAQMLMRIQRFGQPSRSEERVGVDLSELAKECIEFTRPIWKDQAEIKDVYFQVKQELNPVPRIEGNAADLREAVVNLIQNAVEAMPRGGTLEVGTASRGQEGCLWVRDTGVGIPEGDIEKLFTPYFTTKGRDGSGLGLSAVRSIVSAYGGRVQVESEVGQGSIFTICLPIGEGSEPEA